MAFRDSWHRALVYFGLAEERDPYDEEDDAYEPEAELEDRYRERPNVRRLGSRRRRDEFDDIFADDDAARRGRRPRCAPCAAAATARSDVRVHLVIPKSFNDAQQVADKFKDSIPVVLNLQGIETDLSKRLIDFASGLTYALDGGMQRIADKVFMLTPRNVEISAEERAQLIEKGFFNQTSLRLSVADRPHRRGSMARALALGWGEPVLCTDSSPSARGRWPTRSAARRSLQRRGRRSAPTSSCSATSPPSSRRSPPRSRRTRRPSSRSSAATPLARRQGGLPGPPGRTASCPSTPVEVRQGAVILAADDDAGRRRSTRRSASCSPSSARSSSLDDALVDVAMGLMSCAPAYFALVAEAQVDAGVRTGSRRPGRRARRPDDGRHRRAAAPRASYDTLAVRREVTSPGGSTARGLDALERGGLRAAFSDALDAVLRPMTLAVLVLATARDEIAELRAGGARTSTRS